MLGLVRRILRLRESSPDQAPSQSTSPKAFASNWAAWAHLDSVLVDDLDAPKSRFNSVMIQHEHDNHEGLSGSGLCINGFIVTAYHVAQYAIREFEAGSVSPSTHITPWYGFIGYSFDKGFYAYDKSNDIAILQQNSNFGRRTVPWPRTPPRNGELVGFKLPSGHLQYGTLFSEDEQSYIVQSPAIPGFSGSACFAENGDFLGILTRGNKSFSYVTKTIHIRRLFEFAKHSCSPKRPETLAKLVDELTDAQCIPEGTIVKDAEGTLFETAPSHYPRPRSGTNLKPINAPDQKIRQLYAPFQYDDYLFVRFPWEPQSTPSSISTPQSGL